MSFQLSMIILLAGVLFLAIFTPALAAPSSVSIRDINRSCPGQKCCSNQNFCTAHSDCCSGNCQPNSWFVNPPPVGNGLIYSCQANPTRLPRGTCIDELDFSPTLHYCTSQKECCGRFTACVPFVFGVYEPSGKLMQGLIFGHCTGQLFVCAKEGEACEPRRGCCPGLGCVYRDINWNGTCKKMNEIVFANKFIDPLPSSNNTSALLELGAECWFEACEGTGVPWSSLFA